jgi:predicted metal-dependent phosphoesterase TrpH
MGSETYKLDLHTHSVASPDGSLELADFRAMLGTGSLSFVAITDHNTITYAQMVREELGDRIIIGEEINTTEGEIIGLYLKKAIEPGLKPHKAAELIHKQGGLVYIPHPFETVRKGFTKLALDELADEVDIVEVFNGRALAKHTALQAKAWVTDHGVPGAASSDAHGKRGWGKTYTVIDQMPSVVNLCELLKNAALAEQHIGMPGLLYPKLNRLRIRKRRKH